MNEDLLPLEKFLELNSDKAYFFPHNRTDYFDKYITIKKYLAKNVYPLIHAGTSSEDGGVYTDHSIDHFNSVINYLGKLLNIQVTNLEFKLPLNPYEIYISLVAILLHDAGNIFGRLGHEKKTLSILKEIGPTVSTDTFEIRNISSIAKAHGGKTKEKDGTESKETISKLDEQGSLGGITFRPRLIAALVRFADEICEDRSRAANYLMRHKALPQFSEVYHHYANSISSVDIDIESKRLLIRYEIESDDVLSKFGKGSSQNIEEVYLIDEINSRLEKMFHELLYCRNFMQDGCSINRIRASITIYLDDDQSPISKSFDLEQNGYPTSNYLFSENHPEWCGEKIATSISFPQNN